MTDPTRSGDAPFHTSIAGDLHDDAIQEHSDAAGLRRETDAVIRARRAIERFDVARARFAACSAAPPHGEPRLPLQGLWGARSGVALSNPRGGVATRAFADARGAIVAAGCCLLEDEGDYVRVTWPEGAGFRATMMPRVDYDRHCGDGTLVE